MSELPKPELDPETEKLADLAFRSSRPPAFPPEPPTVADLPSNKKKIPYKSLIIIALLGFGISLSFWATALLR